MSSARRPLLTAAAAGALLGALWFVPSANASSRTGAADTPAPNPSSQVTQQARATSTDAGIQADTGPGTEADTAADPEAQTAGTRPTRLADTGSFDSTPYVVGGATFLSMGAGFVVYSVRRERLGF
ncbi:hypothetical protein [Streptomyces ziwulingensis]|uniref:Cell wall protein n=1 Tax=Streptomyces ziwulingensis TaxID=1045501 RepID=A0ABP9AMM4_9ACTN